MQLLQNGDVSNFQTIEDNFDTLNDIVSGKQDIIDSSHKLSSSNVDYTTSALRFIDISSNLQSQLDSLAA